MDKAGQSLGVLTVATNIYIKYWEDMILSFDQVIDEKQRVVSHLFTDQPELAKQIGFKLTKIHLNIHQIESYVWPEATLLRYKIFANKSHFLTEDILMHLDADMLVHSDPLPLIVTSCSKNDINLVSHPGYWRKDFNILSISEIRDYLKDKPRLRSLIRRQPMGAWENNDKSIAYVTKQNRKNYVCGGAWFGNRSEMIDLLTKLSDLTDTDISNGVIPTWHDESVLNRWATENSHGLLPPSLSYVAEYEHLKSLTRIIQAVTKSDKTR
jgi:hypothetical protein